MRRYHVLGAQRHTRILGTFLRLIKRDGRQSYAKFLPRVMRQMQASCQAAGLDDIEGFLDRNLDGWRHCDWSRVC